MPSIIEGDRTYTGSVVFAGPVYLSAGGINNAMVAANAAIAASKLQHSIIRGISQAHGVAASAERRIVHVARGAGTVKAMRIIPTVAAIGDSTQSWNLLKNGSSVLNADTAQSLTSATAAYGKVSATVDSAEAAYVAGDVFELVATVTAGTGTLPQGVEAQAEFYEAGE